jgi:hypothetical protein
VTCGLAIEITLGVFDSLRAHHLSITYRASFVDPLSETDSAAEIKDQKAVDFCFGERL